jgi:hypothetical protein
MKSQANKLIALKNGVIKLKKQITAACISKYFDNSKKNVVLTCASYEKRCLGLPRKAKRITNLKQTYLFFYNSVNPERERNMAEMEKIFSEKGNIEIISTKENEPSDSIKYFYQQLRKMLREENKDNISINLDITTFTKRHLILLLKVIDDLGLWENLRIFYSEPKDYIVDLYLPMSKGINDISRIDSFVGNNSPNLPKLLVIFLGYEGDRAKAIYENEDPNDLILVVPKPAYHKTWENRTENMNLLLLSMVGNKKIRYANSLDSQLVFESLQKILVEFPFDKWRWSIVPLGTKPQIIGLYMFWRQNKDLFSIIYASPLKHNYPFYSKGLGKTWLLKDVEN